MTASAHWIRVFSDDPKKLPCGDHLPLNCGTFLPVGLRLFRGFGALAGVLVTGMIGGFGTGKAQFERVGLTVMFKRALRESQLQLQIFDFLSGEAWPGQAITDVLNRVFKVNDMGV